MIVKMPELSGKEGKAVLTAWYAVENESINEGDDFLEVVTDKASFDIPAPCSGIVRRIYKQKGENIFTGDMLAEIE